MKNIAVFSWDIKEKYNREINTLGKGPEELFEYFTEDTNYIFFRELLSNIFGTNDIIIIKPEKNGTHIFYKDYNNFIWDKHSLSKKQGGLSEILSKDDLSIEKLSKGHLFVQSIKSDYFLFKNLNDFKEQLFTLPTIIAEICFNIYHYEYIYIPELVNINKYFNINKRYIDSLNLKLNYGELIDLIRDDGLSKLDLTTQKNLVKLISKNFYW